MSTACCTLKPRRSGSVIRLSTCKGKTLLYRRAVRSSTDADVLLQIWRIIKLALQIWTVPSCHGVQPRRSGSSGKSHRSIRYLPYSTYRESAPYLFSETGLPEQLRASLQCRAVTSPRTHLHAYWSCTPPVLSPEVSRSAAHRWKNL